MPIETPSGRLSSVTAALRLLKIFSADEPELGISAMAQRLALAKSTVHRLSTTLVAEGMLEQNAATGRYRLGLGLFALGSLVQRRMDVSRQAVVALTALRDRTDETVDLAILDGTEIVYLQQLEGSQAIRMHAPVGSRRPAFCTAEGRVLLAFGPEAQVRSVVAAGLGARTPHTRVTPEELRTALEEVRGAGHAFDNEECEAGMRGLAAPIRDATGQVVAAVGLNGPTQRLNMKVLRGFTTLVSNAAQAISLRLGHGVS